MELFACNACNHIFQAEAQPNACPSCHLDSVLGSTDSGRRVSLPAVRAATEAEVQAYEEAGKAAQEEKDFLEWLDGLSSYDLSNDEYHVALMLLHSFRTSPGLYTRACLKNRKRRLFAQKGPSSASKILVNREIDVVSVANYSGSSP